VADELDPEALAARLAGLDVAEFIVATASTLSGLAYTKLEQGNLPESRHAIDALVSLMPHVHGELKRDLEQTLVGLQLAFSSAAST
jgi:hypothetical protein